MNLCIVPIDILQRLTWHGEAKELGVLFRVTKNRREARAVIYSHEFGWEVRLLVGSQVEAVRTQVCRTQDELVTTGETWKAALLAEGWTVPE